MSIDHAVDNSEPEPGPFALRLCGEEWFKDSPLRRLIHSCSRVTHTNQDIVILFRIGEALKQIISGNDMRLDSDRAPDSFKGLLFCNRVACIDAEVQHSLLQLSNVSEEKRKIVAQDEFKTNIRRKCLREKLREFPKHIIHPDRFEHAARLPGKCQQLLNQPRPTRKSLSDRIHRMGLNLMRNLRTFQSSEIAYGDGENIIEVMSDSTGKRPDTLHPLNLSQLIFESALLGDIPQYTSIGNDFPYHTPNSRCGLEDDQRTTVLGPGNGLVVFNIAFLIK